MFSGDPLGQARGDLFDRMLQDLFRGTGAGRDPQVAQSLGSGVIIDPSGYILTNYHVIERATTIRVTLSDRQTYLARMVAGDELNDLALIRIDAGRPLQAIRMAADGDAMLGETVIVLGNPFGLGHSVTVGVLSAKDREARHRGEVIFQDILQTDAAVNPGNSGGPLLNLDGELIGLNVAIHEAAQNIGFAVPVHRARALLVQWLSPRTLNRVLLGFDLEEREGAVVVTRLTEPGPATGSGLRPGDRLISAEGRGVENLLDFVRALLNARPGDVVVLGYGRGTEAGVARVTLARLPAPKPDELARARLGLILGEAKDVSGIRGLAVAEVMAGGPMARAGLEVLPGLLLSSINGIRVQTAEDAAMALESVRTGEPVRVEFVQVAASGPGALSARITRVQIRAG
jgi:serine protease Do